MEIHITSDHREQVPGVVTWRLTNVRGDTLTTGALPVDIRPNGNMLATTVDLSEELKSSGPRELMLWLELSARGGVVSTNFVSFARPKHMALEQPMLRAKVTDLGDGSFRVTLEAEKPALWAWIALGPVEARYSDNFVHVVPDKPVEIVVTPRETMTPEELESNLELRSLFDTFEA